MAHTSQPRTHFAVIVCSASNQDLRTSVDHAPITGGGKTINKANRRYKGVADSPTTALDPALPAEYSTV